MISRNMKEKGKHMDEVFREGLSDLNVTPPADVWEVVENSIHRRKVIFSLIPRLAAASLLLFVLTGSLWLIFLRKPLDKGLADQPVFSPQQSKTQSISGETGKQSPAKTISSLGREKEKSGQQAEATEKQGYSQAKQQGPLASRGTGSPAISSPVAARIGIEPVNTATTIPVAVLTTTHKIKFVLLIPRDANLLNRPQNILSLAWRAEKPQFVEMPLSPVVNKQERKQGVWGMGGELGPVYAYRNLASGSPYFIAYLNNEENGMVSFAGNLSVFYQRNKRFSFQSGVSYYHLGQVSRDVIAFRRIKSGDLAYLRTKGNEFIHVSDGKIGYNGTPLFVANRMNPSGNDQTEYLLNRLGTGLYEPVDVHLKQDMEFVEIPFLVRYKLVDRALGVNLIGGMGSSFLLKGQASVVSQKGETVLGNLYDLRKANINGTLGVGFSYRITSNFQLRIEPTFKYYLNPIYRNADIATHPYSVGVFSGVSIFF